MESGYRRNYFYSIQLRRPETDQGDIRPELVEEFKSFDAILRFCSD
jgi:hypothetical protein